MSLVRASVLALLLAMPLAASSAAADTTPIAKPTIFDPPVAVTRLALAKSRADPTAKNELACFTFKEVRVRQLDRGEVGAAELAILPLQPHAAPVACRKTKEAGEIVIPGEAWSGYFKGVRAGFVLFDAEDGTNGGLGFAVFDGRSGKKLFSDLAVGDIRSAEPTADGITLRYRRAAVGACSMPHDGTGCWEKTVAAASDLRGAAVPDCAAGYLAAKKAMATGRCEASGDKSTGCFDREMQLLDAQRWDEAPSVIGYEAEARITRTAQTVGKLAGELSCWPAD